MGADIYLRSAYDKAQEHYTPIFDAAIKEREEVMNKVGRDKITYDDDFNIAGPPEVMEAQKKVNDAFNAMRGEDAYFRDSYNPTSLFNKLGLSWWALANELIDANPDRPIIKNGDEEYKENVLMIPQAKLLLERFEIGDAAFDEAKITARVKETFDFNDDGTSKTKGGSTVSEWVEHYREKHARWVALLKRSIELNEPLYWSV